MGASSSNPVQIIKEPKKPKKTNQIFTVYVGNLRLVNRSMCNAIDRLLTQKGPPNPPTVKPLGEIIDIDEEQQNNQPYLQLRRGPWAHFSSSTRFASLPSDVLALIVQMCFDAFLEIEGRNRAIAQIQKDIEALKEMTITLD